LIKYDPPLLSKISNQPLSTTLTIPHEKSEFCKRVYNIIANPANIPPTTTAKPYVFPRFNAAIAADLAAVVEVEVAVVPPAPPNAPKPVVVAEPAEPVPEEPAEVEVEIVEVFTRVGSWAPQG